MKNTALITGASSGLGKQFAYIHASRQGDLVIVARSEDKLLALKQELETNYGVSVKVIVKDLTEKSAPETLYKIIKDEYIEIDYLINNAGFGGIGKFHERDWEKDEAMIQLNVMALAHFTRLFLPDFVKRNRGKILNISSIASLMPGPLQATYYASKAFVSSFSMAIAEELKNTNVTITTLLPGPTETQFGQISGMDNTKAFDTQIADAYKVALAGYNAMMKGKLKKMSGVGFLMKIMLKLIPFLPQKLVLKTIYYLQKEKN